MPLSTLELITAVRFRLTKAVVDWADIEQGENELTLSLDQLDLSVWNQVFAFAYELDATDTATINLQSFTNLAGEAVVMTAALAVAVYVRHTDPEDTDGELTIGPGASNGLVAWFLPDMVVDAPTAGSIRSWVMSGNTVDDGVTVDATHKTIDLENTGTDTITVRVIVLGST